MPKSKFVRVNGINMHYLEWGEPHSPDVLLVHGWTSWAQSWAYVAEKIQDRFHVIAPDHRGHGDSDKPETGYRLLDFAEDMHQLIQGLNLAKPLYAGNSWGGCIGTIMAADYSQDISAAFLGDPVYWKMINAFVTRLPSALDRRKVPDEELVVEMRQRGLSPEAITAELERLHRFSEKALVHLLTDNRDFALGCEEYLKRIKVPTHIVAADPLAGGYILEEEASYIQRIASPMVQVSRWEGVGHGISNEQPDRYVEEMLAFFERVINDEPFERVISDEPNVKKEELMIAPTDPESIEALDFLSAVMQQISMEELYPEEAEEQ